MKNFSDEQLIALFLEGNQAALNFLIERYLKRVYNFSLKYVGGEVKSAEDLTQEIFLKVWKNLKKFDPQKSFKVWLFSIARHAGIDYWRRKKIPVFSSLERDDDDSSFAEGIVDETESVVEKINRQELAAQVNQYLARLSEQNQAVLILHYNQQLTFQEIAQLLGQPLDTVKSRHRRALLYLRRLIEEEGGSAPKIS